MSNIACEMTEKFREDQGTFLQKEEEEGKGAAQFPCSYKLWVLW